jgi:hypothetical protein
VRGLFSPAIRGLISPPLTTFPIALTDSIAVVGEDWEATVISAHAEEGESFYEAVTLSGDRCSFRKFRVIHEGAPTGIWTVVVRVKDTCSNAQIDSVMIVESVSTAALRVDGANSTVVENCLLSQGGSPSDRGMELVFNENGTLVRNCTVIGFSLGMFFNYPSDALVEYCTLENNGHGFYLCCLDDPNSKPNPDLGGGARGSAGGQYHRGQYIMRAYESDPQYHLCEVQHMEQRSAC